MLLRDPYALHSICCSVLDCLLQLFEKNKLPRVKEEGLPATIMGGGKLMQPPLVS